MYQIRHSLARTGATPAVHGCTAYALTCSSLNLGSRARTEAGRPDEALLHQIQCSPAVAEYAAGLHNRRVPAPFPLRCSCSLGVHAHSNRASSTSLPIPPTISHCTQLTRNLLPRAESSSGAATGAAPARKLLQQDFWWRGLSGDSSGGSSQQGAWWLDLQNRIMASANLLDSRTPLPQGEPLTAAPTAP